MIIAYIVKCIMKHTCTTMHISCISTTIYITASMQYVHACGYFGAMERTHSNLWYNALPVELHSIKPQGVGWWGGRVYTSVSS